MNDQQEAAVDAIRQKKNIFLTGAGGTGKSHTIRFITEWCNTVGIRVAITAMTGCAALLLGGKTLHSWAGIGLGRETPAELAAVILKKTPSRRRWLDTQLLVIDEISMMDPELLEKLDRVARLVRKQPLQRFGGLQLVLSGDFCQLPPVQKDKETVFAFESPVWSTLIDETHNLLKIERQHDPIFQRILGEARLGVLTQESIDILKGRMNKIIPESDILPTLLYSRNKEVDMINKKNMDVLDGSIVAFDVQTVFQTKHRVFLPTQSIDVQRALERLDLDAPYEAHLELKLGAQVMLLTNLDQEAGLVNGSRGVITGFAPSGLPMVRFLNTSNSIIIDRASWWLPDDNYTGRSQIPLKIAYAITIHKSQGSTLDCALIDIGSNTFEYGQAYVALSRVRSLEGLYIHRINPKMILCHPKVVAFYKSNA
jgi:ATP-dependent DNA helicase PIF1